MKKVIAIDRYLSKRTIERLEKATIEQSGRLQLELTVADLASICVEATVASGRLDELIDQLVLETLN